MRWWRVDGHEASRYVLLPIWVVRNGGVEWVWNDERASMIGRVDRRVVVPTVGETTAETEPVDDVCLCLFWLLRLATIRGRGGQKSSER